MSVTLKEKDRGDSCRGASGISVASLLKLPFGFIGVKEQSMVFASLVAIVPTPGMFRLRSRNEFLY